MFILGRSDVDADSNLGPPLVGVCKVQAPPSNLLPKSEQAKMKPRSSYRLSLSDSDEECYLQPSSSIADKIQPQQPNLLPEKEQAKMKTRSSYQFSLPDSDDDRYIPSPPRDADKVQPSPKLVPRGGHPMAMVASAPPSRGSGKRGGRGGGGFPSQTPQRPSFDQSTTFSGFGRRGGSSARGTGKPVRFGSVQMPDTKGLVALQSKESSAASLFGSAAQETGKPVGFGFGSPSRQFAGNTGGFSFGSADTRGPAAQDQDRRPPATGLFGSATHDSVRSAGFSFGSPLSGFGQTSAGGPAAQDRARGTPATGSFGSATHDTRKPVGFGFRSPSGQFNGNVGGSGFGQARTGGPTAQDRDRGPRAAGLFGSAAQETGKSAGLALGTTPTQEFGKPGFSFGTSSTRGLQQQQQQQQQQSIEERSKIPKVLGEYINTSTKVTCHNFDDLVRQCYLVWGNMTSINV